VSPVQIDEAWRHPRLRPIEVLPVVVEEQQMYCLRDPADPAGPSLVVSREALLLLNYMNGERDVGRICSAFTLQTGMAVPQEQVEAFAQRLDEAFLLASPRYETRLAALRADFHAAPRRAATHAGGAYPGDLTALEDTLAGHFTAPDGPGDLPEEPGDRDLVGLVVPHVDLHRGGSTYAWAYRALAEAEPPELVVLLGTCHAPMSTPFAVTAKDYDTPFGPVPTDTGFVHDLAASYSGDLFADEVAHRAEHALEFQAIYLRYLQWRGLLPPVRVVPILCGSPHAHVPRGGLPGDAPGVVEFLDVLAERLADDDRRALIVAAADLAHVGPQFGDPEPVTAPFLGTVAQADRAMLDVAASGEADDFYRSVMSDGDRRRVCGVAPMYAMLDLLPESRGEVLHYTPWADPNGYSAVTFASVAYYRA
jgi:MEMO1 family protein